MTSVWKSGTVRARSRTPKRHGEKHADGRKISVTIRHRRAADLHQADHRHERSQKPKPADQQIRTGPARPPDQPGNGGQRRSSPQLAQTGPDGGWQRIKDGQRSAGQISFQQITHVSHRYVFQAVMQRDRVPAKRRATRWDWARKVTTHEAADEQKERPFFQTRRADLRLEPDLAALKHCPIRLSTSSFSAAASNPAAASQTAASPASAWPSDPARKNISASQKTATLTQL